MIIGYGGTTSIVWGCVVWECKRMDEDMMRMQENGWRHEEFGIAIYTHMESRCRHRYRYGLIGKTYTHMVRYLHIIFC